jgi:hypothetical protein
MSYKKYSSIEIKSFIEKDISKSYLDEAFEIIDNCNRDELDKLSKRINVDGVQNVFYLELDAIKFEMLYFNRISSKYNGFGILPDELKSALISQFRNRKLSDLI